MWLFTTYGFVSLVRDAQQPDHLLLRFRSRAHAESFLRHLELDPPAELRETPDADYRWKFSAPASAVANLLTHFTERLDYTNFKAACSHSPAMCDTSAALHDVWAIMYEYQKSSRHRPEP